MGKYSTHKGIFTELKSFCNFTRPLKSQIKEQQARRVKL